LVVDATDGPMTQTKFVLSKALKWGLKVVVVINKVDRPSARIGVVENEIFDLFVNMEVDLHSHTCKYAISHIYTRTYKHERSYSAHIH
jgi:predicted membrane GTPase involved in stress response